MPEITLKENGKNIVSLPILTKISSLSAAPSPVTAVLAGLTKVSP